MVFQLKHSFLSSDCLDISKITNVSNLMRWTTVGLISWIVMRSSGLAAFSEVTELMNMESMETSSKSIDFRLDDSRVTLLNHLDNTADTRVTVLSKDANCVDCFFGHDFWYYFDFLFCLFVFVLLIIWLCLRLLSRFKFQGGGFRYFFDDLNFLKGSM